MTGRIVNIGDGRFIEMTEGVVGKPAAPKAEPKKPKKAPRINNRYVKKRRVLRKGFEGRGRQGSNERRSQYDEIPGYHEWISDRTKELEAVHPKANHKSRFGVPNGLTKVEAEKVWDEARVLAERDIQRMKEAGVIGPEDVHAEEAMKATLEVMRSPMDQKMKLAAARQVLEWTKAKPASSSNVTVNTAEAWLDSLAGDKE